jgi:DNA-binding response OmpR family regulator
MHPSLSLDRPYGGTILIADDNVDLADLIRSFFRRYHYSVVVVDSGQAAIDHVAQHRAADAIVLDVMMPGVNGWETCRRLRTITNAPILMLSALDSVDNVIHGLEVGADAYLAKPFGLKELKARLEALLRRARPLEVAPQHVGA